MTLSRSPLVGAAVFIGAIFAFPTTASSQPWIDFGPSRNAKDPSESWSFSLIDEWPPRLASVPPVEPPQVPPALGETVVAPPAEPAQSPLAPFLAGVGAGMMMILGGLLAFLMLRRTGKRPF